MSENLSKNNEAEKAVDNGSGNDDNRRQPVKPPVHAGVAAHRYRIEAPGARERSSWSGSALGAWRTLDGRGGMRRATAR